MDDNDLLTKTHLIFLGIGIAIGGSLLLLLIKFWLFFVLAAAGYCIYKGLPPSLKDKWD